MRALEALIENPVWSCGILRGENHPLPSTSRQCSSIKSVPHNGFIVMGDRILGPVSLVEFLLGIHHV